MRETGTTIEDEEFMNLRDEIFKTIPHGDIINKRIQAKKWRRFRNYMEFYYKNYPSILKK